MRKREGVVQIHVHKKKGFNPFECDKFTSAYARVRENPAIVSCAKAILDSLSLRVNKP